MALLCSLKLEIVQQNGHKNRATDQSVCVWARKFHSRTPHETEEVALCVSLLISFPLSMWMCVFCFHTDRARCDIKHPKTRSEGQPQSGSKYWHLSAFFTFHHVAGEKGQTNKAAHGDGEGNKNIHTASPGRFLRPVVINLNYLTVTNVNIFLLLHP